MAQFVVRNLENAVKVKLQRRAQRHGRSMEEEVREILRGAVHEEDVPSGGLGTEIATPYAKGGLDSDIRELRGRKIKPVRFEQPDETSNGSNPRVRGDGLALVDMDRVALVAKADVDPDGIFQDPGKQQIPQPGPSTTTPGKKK